MIKSNIKKKRIVKFMKFYKLKDYDAIGGMQNKMLQVMIEDFVMSLIATQVCI